MFRLLKISTANTSKSFVGLLSGIVVFLAILFFADLEPGKPEITNTFAVAMLMAVWWVTEALPLPVTALVPLAAFPMMGIIDGKAVSEAYMNHIIFLFIGGFIMALAMERWNLHKRIALYILKFVGVSPARILFGFMLASMLLSMWISNTATTMMMIPIVSSIIIKIEESVGTEKISKYALGLLLGIAYSSSIGGMATLVGTPTNLICVRILNVLYPTAPEISFADWFIFAFPVTLFMFAGAFVLLYFIYRPKYKWGELSADTFKIQLKELGKATYQEKVVFILFLILAILWITRAEISSGSFTFKGWAAFFNVPAYINDGTTAIFISLLLFIWPAKTEPGEKIINWETAKHLPWGIVLLFGGGFALADGFEKSGLAIWFGEQLAWGESIPSIVFVFAIVTMMSFLTELTSNVASTQMLLPAFAGIAVATGDNPLLFMIPATIASSLAFMLPTATPPNAIIFGTGRVSIDRMMKTGFSLNFLGIIIVTLMTYLLIGQIFGVVNNVVPEWALQGVK
ncbi:MAG: DASS family sodium-coupled anion symporter [Bacteroidetes bacterium]|nr:MAG: DASS family sodium-coupled anion symporter [Bacteroidota bacterium]